MGAGQSALQDNLPPLTHAYFIVLPRPLQDVEIEMPTGINAKEFVGEPARLCFIWGVADWSTPRSVANGRALTLSITVFRGQLVAAFNVSHHAPHLVCTC